MNPERKRRLTGAPAPAAVDVQSLRSAAAVAHEAQRALSHLEQLADMRWCPGIGSPAEVYQVLGEGTRIAQTLDPTMSALARWMDQQITLNQLVAEAGPFAGEPGAAVSVAKQALDDARKACFDLAQALERAQLATAHLAAPGPQRLSQATGHRGAGRWSSWTLRRR